MLCHARDWSLQRIKLVKLPALLAQALKQLLMGTLNPDPAPIMPKLVEELYPKLVVLYYVALSCHVVLEPLKTLQVPAEQTCVLHISHDQ
jgi:hypothetical protein